MNEREEDDDEKKSESSRTSNRTRIIVFRLHILDSVKEMKKKRIKKTEFENRANDPLGSWTGTDVTDGTPVQDADDL